MSRTTFHLEQLKGTDDVGHRYEESAALYVCSFFDCHRAEELIQFGYERTTEALAHYSKPGTGPTSDTELPPEA